MNNTWVDVNGYEGKYQVNCFGEIRSFVRSKSPKILKPQLNKGGYPSVILGRKHNKRMHRLIASAFIENTYNKACINHKDGNKQNNQTYNLEWCTYSENHKHAYRTGLREPVKNQLGKTGDLSANSIDVYQYTKEGYFITRFGSAREAMRYTGIHHSGISRVCKGERKSAGGYIWKFNKES